MGQGSDVGFSVAANYDRALVSQLAAHPVSEVYGKLPHDGIGGGRPRYLATPLPRRQLAAYVADLRRVGIDFNYLLNGACFANREWSRAWQRRLMRLLTDLGTMGVRRVTVATPYLLELIKRRFPEFHVRVGIFAQIDTPRRARFWADLGADAITLESFSINRDFARLAAIRAAVDCELQLIANHVCLPNCPMQNYHQNGFAHASDGSRALFIDWCFLRCSQRRLSEPAELIKAGWIRPEDIDRYAAMGFTTFKLLERGIPSAALLRRVAAYHHRHSGEDLAELLLPYGFAEPRRREAFWGLRNFFRPRQVAPARLRPLLALARDSGMLAASPTRPVRIATAAIPADFLEGFRERDCASLRCDDCGYCAGIAARAVQIDPDHRQRALAAHATAADDLLGGSTWGV